MAKWIVVRVVEVEVEADSAGDAVERSRVDLPPGHLIIGARAKRLDSAVNVADDGESFDIVARFRAPFKARGFQQAVEALEKMYGPGLVVLFDGDPEFINIARAPVPEGS